MNYEPTLGFPEMDSMSDNQAPVFVSTTQKNSPEDDSTTQSEIEQLIKELEEGYSQENFDSEALGQKKLALVQAFLGFYTAPITQNFDNALESANSFLQQAQSTCGFDDFFTPIDIPQQEKSKDDATNEEIEAENLAYQNEVATINNNNIPKIIIILALFDMYKDLITKSFMPNNNLPFCNSRFFIALKGLANDAFNVYKKTAAGKNSLLQKHFYDVCSDYNDVMKCPGWTEVYSGIFYNILSFLYKYQNSIKNKNSLRSVDFMNIIIFNEEHQIGLDRFDKTSSFGGGHIGTSFLIEKDGQEINGICTNRTDASLADVFKQTYTCVTQDSTILTQEVPFSNAIINDLPSSLKVLNYVYEVPEKTENKKYFKISTLWPERIRNNFFATMQRYYNEVKNYFDSEKGLNGFIIFDTINNNMPVSCSITFFHNAHRKGQVISSFYPCSTLGISEDASKCEEYLNKHNSVDTVLSMYAFFDDLVCYVINGINQSPTNIPDIVSFYRRALVTFLDFLKNDNIEMIEKYFHYSHFLKSFLQFNEPYDGHCKHFDNDMFQKFMSRSIQGRLDSNCTFLNTLCDIFDKKMQGFASLHQDIMMNKKEDFVFFLVSKCFKGGLFDRLNNIDNIKNKGSKKIAIVGIINLLQNYHIFLKDFNTLQTDNKWIDYCQSFWSTIFAGNSISIQVINENGVKFALYDCDASVFHGNWPLSNNVNANNVNVDDFKYKQFKIQSLIQACKERRTAARNNRMPQPSI